MRVEKFWEIYDRYNPISNYAIKPTLNLVDAHNNPLRGGIAAALVSGLVHYGAIEAIIQTTDLVFGTNVRDPETKMALTRMFSEPYFIPVHILIGTTMYSNLVIGIEKYSKLRNSKKNIILFEISKQKSRLSKRILECSKLEESK